MTATQITSLTNTVKSPHNTLIYLEGKLLGKILKAEVVIRPFSSTFYCKITKLLNNLGDTLTHMYAVEKIETVSVSSKEGGLTTLNIHLGEMQSENFDLKDFTHLLSE